MARKKSAPIRREVDRFHPDSLEARSVNLVAFGPGSESDDEAIDDSDYEQCNNLAAESKSTEESEWILNYSLKDFFPNRLDSIRSDDFIGWIECSRKLLPVAKCSTSSCHSDKPCVALHIAGKDLLIVCNICRSCLLQSSNTASSVALCRSLQQAVNTNTIRLRVSSATTTTIEIWLNPTSPQLSSILLNWALMGSTLRRRNDSGGWYEARPGTSTDRSIENQFSALQFLDSVTTAQSAMRKSDSTELLQHLKKLGVRTKLRDYQLQGVQWMHDRLTPRHHLPQLSTSSANMTLALEDWQYNAVGWVRLSTSTPPEAASAPAPAPGSSSDRSGSSSGNSNTSCQSTITWYNIHTEEIVHSDKPPVSSALQLPTSLILADEMGVGKSLQIISLVLLLLSSSPAPSAYNAPTLFTNAMDVDAPERASSENTQNAGEGGDFAGAGDSGEYWMDTAAAPALSAGSAPAELVDPESSGRSCLCGSSEDLANKTQRLLGWIQCASCYTWLHAPCAGFFDTETMQNCAEYTCLACSCLKHYTQPVQSRTTLIVMPNTLITQWKAELLKHVEKVTFNNPDAAEGGLKVFIYPEEVGNKKSEDYSRLDPRTLVRYDIVLLSFKALQKGYHDSNVDYTSTRILRCSYAIYPPAFMCLHYALVVVDETQNIESTTSQVLSMALRIPSTHRISVSGTPFGTGKLADLYTLCQFLRVEPYASDRTAWLRVIEKPAVCITAEVRMQYLREVFQRLLLRRTKQMIHAELGLPEHTVITKPLQFSTFEVLFLLIFLSSHIHKYNTSRSTFMNHNQCCFLLPSIFAFHSHVLVHALLESLIR